MIASLIRNIRRLGDSLLDQTVKLQRLEPIPKPSGTGWIQQSGNRILQRIDLHYQAAANTVVYMVQRSGQPPIPAESQYKECVIDEQYRL